MTALRILTVTHFFEGHGGGIERVAGQLCREFGRLGAAAIWAASEENSSSIPDIETLPLKCINPIEKLTGLPLPVPGMRAIRDLSREIGRSDAVIVHDALYVTSLIAFLIAKLRRKKVILIQHIAGIRFRSVVLRGLVAIANRLVARPLVRAADERIFISDVVRRDLLGERSQLGELLFNGVDTQIFYPVENNALRDPAAVANFPTRAGGSRLLFVGRYVDKKGLKVLRELARLCPERTIVLAGRGPIKPRDWGLPNVHDVGPQKQQDLADLYRWADLLILPSVGEGFPLVIQEAMACGLPVICGTPTNRADPDASKWLRGVEIDLCDIAGSAQRCSREIAHFSAVAAERLEMSRYARRRYSWPAMAERLVAMAKPSSSAWKQDPRQCQGVSGTCLGR